MRGNALFCGDNCSFTWFLIEKPTAEQKTSEQSTVESTAVEENSTEMATQKKTTTLIYSDEKFNITYIGNDNGEIKFKCRNKTDDKYNFYYDSKMKINGEEIDTKYDYVFGDVFKREQKNISVKTNNFKGEIKIIELELLADNYTNKDEPIHKIKINATIGEDVEEVGATEKVLLYENDMFSISYDRIDIYPYSYEDERKFSVYFIIQNKTDEEYSFSIDKIITNEKPEPVIGYTKIAGNSEDMVDVDAFLPYFSDISDIGNMSIVFTYMNQETKYYEEISTPPRNVKANSWFYIKRKHPS